MLDRIVTAAWAATLLVMLGAGPAAAGTGPTATPSARAMTALVARLHAASRERDSLSTLADSTRGVTREFLEEQILQRGAEIRAGVQAAIAQVRSGERRGEDMTEARRILSDALREDWPHILVQLKRRTQGLLTLGRSSDAATGADRLAIESQMSQESNHILNAYRSLVDALIALEAAKFDLTAQRQQMMEGLTSTAQALVTRLKLASRARASAVSRLSRDASNAELRYDVEACEERVTRASQSLSSVIEMMNRFHLETTDLRVALIASNGRLTADVFRWKVFVGLLATWSRIVFDFLAERAPHWLFQGLLIAITFFGFRALAHLVRRLTRSAMRHSSMSELMRATVVRLSGSLVMLVGFMVILTQLGVQVAPLLAGFGVAGVVIGFAMQNALSNFAAGGMILGNQPFDLGDEIEVAGVVGTVKRMTLVSTTIMTPDNQTLVVPNSAVWGGVIRNRTAQPTRRVDLTFSVGYEDDIDKAERVLREIVTAQEHVLEQPAPIVKLHQLADSSVNFVVRVWARKERYWDVYWEITRQVKLRFDEEHITIPYPQRDLHMKTAPGPPPGTAPETAAKPEARAPDA